MSECPAKPADVIPNFVKLGSTGNHGLTVPMALIHVGWDREFELENVLVYLDNLGARERALNRHNVILAHVTGPNGHNKPRVLEHVEKELPYLPDNAAVPDNVLDQRTNNYHVLKASVLDFRNGENGQHAMLHAVVVDNSELVNATDKLM